MQDLNVSISFTAYEILESLAKQTGETFQSILDKAIEAYRRQLFLEEANQAFTMLRNDEVAWKEELDEREIWDCTLSDGVAEG